MPTASQSSTEWAARLQGFSWRHASRRQSAVQGIDLEIARGERIMLTGDSGAGKSTLLAALAGVLGGADEGEQAGVLVRHASVGMVLQDPDSQVICSRVGDDVAFGCENLGMNPDEIWPRVREALDLVGLDLPLDHPTKHLSGGQKQRLALAGVIAMGAELILLDEPTANLDPAGQREVVAAVGQVLARTGAALVVVEHRPHLWAPLIDRFLHLGPEGVCEITEQELARPPEFSPAPAVPPGTEALVIGEGLLTRFGPPRSLELPSGHSTVITGANGVGKSTLLQTIGGLLPHTAGTLEYSARLRGKLSGSALGWSSRELARRIGYVFQDPEHQFVTNTVAKEMSLSGAPQARITELLERLRLNHLAQANPFTLSGGEKRRLSVATALVNAPQLLLLDEPTFGQDPRTLKEMVEIVRELSSEGVTVAAVTHDEYYIHALGSHEVAL